ncbi:GNAT family N-acetyltransferase [Cellulomonas endophytica]|uniref:GNAT family N-acetyltransferase n=1 Tax=Cellulomonas endophytica TaxID=2494735 RepID=UPI001F0CC237|nr:GNAT family protein [Cellulomonas endophytica]
MSTPDTSPLRPLRPRPTLRTEHLVLVPLGPEHAEGTWRLLQDDEGNRLTGTTATFTRASVDRWLAGLAASDDRLDWAVTRAEDGAYLGEVVLNDLDAESATMNFRIALLPEGRGRGLGTEATRAVVEHAFSGIGLHRVTLDVLAYNPGAQRAYEKAGFVVEGRRRHDLRWRGEWVDAVLMSILETDPR